MWTSTTLSYVQELKKRYFREPIPVVLGTRASFNDRLQFRCRNVYSFRSVGDGHGVLPDFPMRYPALWYKFGSVEHDTDKRFRVGLPRRRAACFVHGSFIRRGCWGFGRERVRGRHGDRRARQRFLSGLLGKLRWRSFPCRVLPALRSVHRGQRMHVVGALHAAARRPRI